MTSFNQLEVICSELHINTVLKFGRSPGLVVMGGDSRSKSHGFESQHCILDGHFFTYIFVVKICNVCLKRPKINEKEAGVGPFFFKKKDLKKIIISYGKIAYVWAGPTQTSCN